MSQGSSTPNGVTCSWEETEPLCWEELLAELHVGEMSDSHSASHHWKCPYVFRGMPDYSWKLVTTLMREGVEWRSLENSLLDEFKHHARDEFRSRHLDPHSWESVFLARHYGLPTRLMDWTFSPFAALHFATADLELFNVDGAVWCVNYPAVHRAQSEWLRALIDHPGLLDAVELQSLAKDSKGLDHLAEEQQHDLIVFVQPPLLDVRIRNQLGLFSIAGHKSHPVSDSRSQNSDRNPFENIDELLPAILSCRPNRLTAGNLLRRVRICAQLKWEIRDRLDALNQSEAIFSPGLDQIANWIARKHRKRRPRPIGWITKSSDANKTSYTKSVVVSFEGSGGLNASERLRKEWTVIWMEKDNLHTIVPLPEHRITELNKFDVKSGINVRSQSTLCIDRQFEVHPSATVELKILFGQPVQPQNSAESMQFFDRVYLGCAISSSAEDGDVTAADFWLNFCCRRPDDKLEEVNYQPGFERRIDCSPDEPCDYDLKRVSQNCNQAKPNDDLDWFVLNIADVINLLRDMIAKSYSNGEYVMDDRSPRRKLIVRVRHPIALGGIVLNEQRKSVEKSTLV